MASYDAWIKQYRPDENTANTSINYYPKGAVIAFLLDAKIRKATNGARSLDTGMQWAMQRYSGEKGYTPDQFYAVMSEAAGADLKGWFAKTAESTDELDYTEALDYYGLRFRPVDPAQRPRLHRRRHAQRRGPADRDHVGAARHAGASTPVSTWTTRSSRSTTCASGPTAWRPGSINTSQATRSRCWSRAAIG